MKTHSEKLRDTLKELLASELGEHLIKIESGDSITDKSIRIVPPQVPDYIEMKVIEGRGIECLVYQSPRVETSSRGDLEFYEVVLQQHNLKQPTNITQKLITDLFTGVKPIRQQQAQIKGETSLEKVFMEIPRWHNFDSPKILKKMAKLIA